MQGLGETGHELVDGCVDRAIDLLERVRAEKPDLVFIALHGGWGEDGRISPRWGRWKFLHGGRAGSLHPVHGQDGQQDALPQEGVPTPGRSRSPGTGRWRAVSRWKGSGKWPGTRACREALLFRQHRPGSRS